MPISRRKFIRNSGLAAAGVALLPGRLFAGQKSPGHILGIQLYTVRDDMKKDPVGTLKKLKAMGYTHVEHAGYQDRKFYGHTPEDFKGILKDIGLIMLSGHTFLGAAQWNKSGNDFTDAWKDTFLDAALVGMKYVISPGLDVSLCKSLEDFKWYIGLFNKSGELARKSGLQFAYHNENYEFNHSLENTRLYDLLLRMTDHSLVAEQIDIGNMYAPGGRAMDYLKKYPGRFKLMHVKDEIKSATDPSGYESSILGTGVVGVHGIVDFARKTGTEFFIIEQENYQDQTPLACADQDLKVMRGWGF